jgi:hypothetical protein
MTKKSKQKLWKKKNSKIKYDDAIAAQNTAVKGNYDELNSNILNLDIGGLQPDKKVTITIDFLTKCEVFKNGFYSFMFPFRLLSHQLFLDEKSLELNLINTAVSIKGNLKTTSQITNIHASHACNFEIGPKSCSFSNFIITQNNKEYFAINYSTEEIREPQMKLEECKQYNDKVAAHISFIPRISDEPVVDPESQTEGKVFK